MCTVLTCFFPPHNEHASRSWIVFLAFQNLETKYHKTGLGNMGTRLVVLPFPRGSNVTQRLRDPDSCLVDGRIAERRLPRWLSSTVDGGLEQEAGDTAEPVVVHGCRWITASACLLCFCLRGQRQVGSCVQDLDFREAGWKSLSHVRQTLNEHGRVALCKPRYVVLCLVLGRGLFDALELGFLTS